MLGVTKDKPKAPEPTASTAGAQTAPEKPGEPPTLKRNTLKLRESVNNEWRLIYPNSITPEDLLLSATWAAAGGELQPGDTIRAMDEARTTWLELLVVGAGKGFTQLLELRRHQLPAARVDGESYIPAHHRLEHTLEEGWRVIRRNTSGEEIVMSSGHAKHEDARRWLLDHPTLRA